MANLSYLVVGIPASSRLVFRNIHDQVVVPVVTPSTGSSGGGRLLPAPGDYGVCKRDIKALEKKKKRIEEQIKKLEVRIDYKEDQLRFEQNMAMLQTLISSLARMQEQLAALYLKLYEIEEEEMVVLTYCINESEWLH